MRELAEEYSGGGARRAAVGGDDEEEDLYARGLFKFSAAEYVAEIEPLYCEMVGRRAPAAMMWI